MINPAITSTPEVMGGKPVITGTRVPVSRILYLLKEGYTLEGISEEYPHISVPLLERAINTVIASYDRPHAA